MRKRQVALYEDVKTEGRPDLPGRGGDVRFGVTIAKKHPKYVYSTFGTASLLHKILRVEMRWYVPGGCGDHLVRLQTPHLHAVSGCGRWFPIDTTRANTCEMPRPDTVLCGFCHGEGPVFGKHGNRRITRQEAADRLGCIEV